MNDYDAYGMHVWMMYGYDAKLVEEPMLVSGCYQLPSMGKRLFGRRARRANESRPSCVSSRALVGSRFFAGWVVDVGVSSEH